MGFAENTPALSHQSSGIQVVSRASSRLGGRLNREFNFNYQGIKSAYLGNLKLNIRASETTSRRVGQTPKIYQHSFESLLG